MSNGKDYYQILGVNKNSTPEEIKQAYRKLAREHHPDVAKDADKNASEKRFKEINEAYQVLSDPQKRSMYDQYGSNAFTGGASGGRGAGGFNAGQWGPFSYTYTGGNGGFGDFDPFDVFEDFFGFRGFGGSRSPKKGKSLYYELLIDFSDAVHGLEKEISVESGKVKIKIPAGARNGTELRFAGKGMPGPKDIPPGDLFITIKVKFPDVFETYGEYLVVREQVDFVDAILGIEIEIPVVDTKEKSGLSNTKLKIPSGTQHNTRFLIRGKGMPKLGGRGQGDILVEVSVNIPSKISKKQKELLEAYKQL